ncbi:uncharacterized protein LOC110924456 [Helianthus annuus]|uniref:uncharacterized protein LOC110924456 n=1 Tax=Helianthus annuus TaxID=4232 RepID=UPI000B8F0DDC|nr:uncharacterized protein LOC110924456 [Helianthus annuus]
MDAVDWWDTYDSSRYLYVYLLHSKDEAFEAFKIYKAEVEKQKEKRIKILRSDRGGEYFNRKFDAFCEEEGIIHERTAPYTPQQNGLAERKNRTLVEMANCIVVESRDVEFFENKFSRDDENLNGTTTSSTSEKRVQPSPIVEEPRKSTRGTQKKVTREVIFAINLDDDPKTFSEAMSSRDAPLWKEEVNDEMDSIMGNGTWELPDLPKGKKSIGS